MNTGAVIIGRNEAAHLAAAIDALSPQAAPLVFVDSASADNSVDIAQGAGVRVLELNDVTGVGIAIARNAGYRAIMQTHPELEFIQFCDGDSEIAANWIDKGLSYLREHPEVGMVCGTIEERSVGRSVYNELRELGWERELGEIQVTGGNMLLRTAALQEVGDFDESFSAGEDYDLCLRLRIAGWKLIRLETQMAVHDAGDLRLADWWWRSVRDGFGFAQFVSKYRVTPHTLWRRQLLSTRFWGGALPVLILLLLLASTRWSMALALLLCLAYPLQFLRIRHGLVRNGVEQRGANLYGKYYMLAKFPEFVGFSRWCLGLPYRKNV